MIPAFLLSAGLLLGQSGAPSAGGAPAPLVDGVPQRHPVAGGQAHSYRIALRRGQLVRIVLEQRGIDLDLRLFDPDGLCRMNMDGPNGSLGSETITWIVEQSGEHRVEIRSLTPQDPSGHYEIRAVVSDVIRPADRERMAAERARAEASRLFSVGTRESRMELTRFREQALRIWKDLGIREEAAVELIGLADDASAAGANEQALHLFEEALSLARAGRNRPVEFLSLRGIGVVHHFSGEPERAVGPLEEALAVFPSLNVAYAPELAFTLSDLAHACWLLGEYEKALGYSQRALALARAAGDRAQEGWALKGLCQVYWSLGEAGPALEYGRTALDIARGVGDRHLEGHLMTALGEIYQSVGDSSKSLELFRAARDLRREMGSRQWEAMALANIAQIHLTQGETDQAISELGQSLTMFREADDRRSQAQSLIRLGEAWEPRGDDVRAVASWEPACAIAAQIGDRLTEAEGYAAIARANRRAGSVEESRRTIDRALERIESLRAEVPGEDLRATFSANKQQLYRFHTDLLLELARREAGNAEAAFVSTERARARALVEAIAQSGWDVPGDLPPDLRSRQQESSAKMHNLERHLRMPGLDETQRRSLNESLVEAEAEYDRLVLETRQRDPGYAALRYPRPLSVSETQALVGPNAALLSYFFTPDALSAFVVTSRGLRVERLAVDPSPLAQRIENFAELLSEGEPSSPIGRRLYHDLVQPLLTTVPPEVKRLVIVPDGVLYDLPFEALSVVQPGLPDRYLIQDFTVSYAPSATTLAALGSPRRRGAAATADLLAFANPARRGEGSSGERAISRAIYDAQGLAVGPLPYSELEVRAIRRYAARGSEVFTGPEATEVRLRRADPNRFRILHFATHGLISSQYPSRSALVLASSGGEGNDGFLQAREISNLKLASDLVVLSACRTARGRVLAGEGVQSLARAFFYAGARSVVASLWNVNDRSTADLMAAFYRHLSNGEPKAHALRSAKLDLLATSSFSPPRFWASFILIGESDETVPITTTAAPWTVWPWVATAVVGVALAAATLRRRARGAAPH
ncbi:MAG TPA: CHAT domain-containing tetratricopeptide repeat protein [Thermoanaerobaculia bacterium]|nr:CHAT domain-containing tetratricopeptide repeat protein [Thermoanaerobaculia bacterium]